MVWPFPKRATTAPHDGRAAHGEGGAVGVNSERTGATGKSPSIFISYRRTSAFIVDHIHEKLTTLFTPSSIFLDRADIEPGATFPERIKSAVRGASITLVVIGRDWISMQDERTFRRRLDINEDWVRHEIEIALNGNGTVVPVLVDGATMPTLEQLPEPLAALTTRNAIALSRDHFREDVDRLVTHIKSVLGREKTNKLLSETGSQFPKPAAIKPSPLTEVQLQQVREELPQWRLLESTIDDDPSLGAGFKRVELSRDFRFNSFIDAIEFMRYAAEQIDTFGHHPRWQNIFRTVTVYFSTWDIGHRPSDRDLKCALMLEKAYKRFIEQA